MQSDKHLIWMDDESYLTGTTIRGSLKLLVTSKGKKIRGICFRIVGRGKCAWTALQPHRSPVQQSLPVSAGLHGSTMSVPSTNSNSASAGAASSASTTTTPDKTELSLQYSGRETYLDETVYLVGSKNAPSFSVFPDNSTFEFAYTLPADLPSTFRGAHGKVKYTLELIVHVPWRFDETYRVPLLVRHALDLNADPAALLPFQRQQTRNVGLLNAGPVSVHVYTPRGGCATGDRLPVQVIVTNRSSVPVEKVKFSLVQLIEYHSTSPARFMRSECVRVVRKEAGGVERKCEQKYEHMLDIPDDLPASRSGRGIVNIRYEIQVEAKLAGLHRNIVEAVPFVVATLPYFAEAAAATTATDAVELRSPAVGWRPMVVDSTSLNGSYSLPPAPAHPNWPPAAVPPEYESPFQRYSAGNGSLRAAAYPDHPYRPSAPAIEFGSPTASVAPSRSSACAQLQYSPPSYAQVYGEPASPAAAASAAGCASPATAIRPKTAPPYPV